MNSAFWPIYEAGEVRRFHTTRVLHPQSVGEHSWGVAFILQWLCYPLLPSAAVLCAALCHDLPESETGDVPAPAKWRHAKLAEALDVAELDFVSTHGLEYDKLTLTTAEMRLLKFADMADLVAYCLIERRMGNTRLNTTAKTGINKMLDLLIDPPPLPTRARLLYDTFIEEVRHNGSE